MAYVYTFECHGSNSCSSNTSLFTDAQVRVVDSLLVKLHLINNGLVNSYHVVCTTASGIVKEAHIESQ